MGREKNDVSDGGCLGYTSVPRSHVRSASGGGTSVLAYTDYLSTTGVDRSRPIVHTRKGSAISSLGREWWSHFSSGNFVGKYLIEMRLIENLYALTVSEPTRL